MRLPSLHHVGQQAGQVARRFPLVVVAAVTATVGALWALDSGNSWSVEVRLLLAGGLGIPAFLAITLWFERRPRRAARAVAQLGCLGLLTALFFAWPNWMPDLAFRRYLQLSLAAHLLAAFAPFARGSELQGFWQYNKTLLLRFLTAQLFAHVLFLGLVVALVALEQLFGIDVPDRLYVRLWAVAAIFFATLYFLGGIPLALGELENDVSYPAPLKVLAQYILLPIVVVYLAILTAYLGKVVITRVWPSGWIGYLVSSVSVLGVLSLLLLFPIQHRQENRWVSTYGRLLYVALLPSLAMSWAAIGKRIGQYGITENRYFLLILSAWLGALCVAYLATRSRDIRWIPMSLCAVALVTAFGPQSAYDLSRRDQLGRLTQLFDRNGMVAEGKVARASAEVSLDDRKEMSAVLTYLLSTHGTRSVQALFEDQWHVVSPDSMPPRGRGASGWDTAHKLLEQVGVEFVPRWEVPMQAGEIAFGPARHVGRAVALDHHHYMVRLPGVPAAPAPATDGGFTVDYDETARAWTLRGPKAQELATIALADVVAAVRQAQAEGAAPPVTPVVVDAREGLPWKLLVDSLFVDRVEEQDRLSSIDALLFFSWEER